MTQGKIWTIFSLIGISFCFSYCGKKTVEPSQEATYFYKNTLGDSLILEVYNRYSNSKTEFELKKGESVSFNSIGDRAYPFLGSDKSPSADTIVIRFVNNKCTTYTLDLSNGIYGGKGVFDLKEYDDYSPQLVSQNYYELHYSIDSTDYKKSLDCDK